MTQTHLPSALPDAALDERARVLDALIAQAAITREQADRTLGLAGNTQRLWTSALVDAGVPAQQLLDALSAVTGLPIIPPERIRQADATILTRLPLTVMERLCVVAVAEDESALWVAYADPLRRHVVDAQMLPMHRACIALESDVSAAITSSRQPQRSGTLGFAARQPVMLAETLLAERQPPSSAPPPTPAPASASASALPAGGTMLTHQSPQAPATSPQSQWMPGAGDRVGPYVILRQLGAGGMATVYLARHAETAREVALKLMLPHLVSEPEMAQRFLKEAQAIVGVKHPNIVELIEAGELAGRPYLVLEFVDGGTLADVLKTAPQLPWPAALELMAQLMEGLAFAHARGVIHRDLKPANLLMTRQGVLKIADFGLARIAGTERMTQTGTMMGTPIYMSPEQAQSRPVDHRSDLYTSGVILYEMLAGFNPFVSPALATSLGLVMHGTIPTLYTSEPTAPPLAELITDRLLHLQAERRFSSAREVLDVLTPVVAEVRARMPALPAELAVNPAETTVTLRQQQASLHLVLGQTLLRASGVHEKMQAAIHLHRATLLDPSHAPAQQLFTQLCTSEGYDFGAPRDARVPEMERANQGPQASPPVLLQLAQAWRSSGNLHRAAAAYKRYLRVKPEDGFVSNQLAAMLGGGAWGEVAVGSSRVDLQACKLEYSIVSPK